MVALGIVSSALGVSAAMLPSWSFVGERVRMQVTESEFVVDGYYEFERGAPEEDLVLRYPFPSDTTFGTPELLHSSVITSQGPRAMGIVSGPDGWRLVLKSSWGRNVSVHIIYRQAMLASHATYVLTSTRDWGRPLGRAVLEVCLPAESKADISPRLPRLEVHDGAQVRWAEFRDWLPEGDLTVRLRKR
jgi:hypothetical protein